MKLILATSNVHKKGEIRRLLPLSYEIVGLDDMGFYDNIPETGSTFCENALQKARHIFGLFNLPVIADDSGLQVDALGGSPGIFSARYSGIGATDYDNVSKLLLEMEGMSNRKARFVAAISLIINGLEYCFEGNCEGNISLKRRGQNGFGYDPVFIPDGYTQSFAELTPVEKNKISHRAKALQKLTLFLNSEGWR